MATAMLPCTPGTSSEVGPSHRRRPRTGRSLASLLLAVLGLVLGAPAHALPDQSDDSAEVTLYFFWGEGCPHCAAAKPF